MAEVDHYVDPAEDARLAYERSRRWAAMARAEWEREGSPFTIVHKNGTEGVHPLWKALRETELLSDRLRERARIKHRGPAPKAVVTADIGESPAAKLRRESNGMRLLT